MLPVDRYMDSYPQPHHFGYYPTSWNEGRPDSSKPLGPWSDYSTPMEYHGFHPAYCPPPPAYYPIRPPHTHLPPPPPFSYHGPYPPYYGGGGGFYPPTYHAPPYFPVDQPRYEYDKGGHCCGCPNHVCKHKGDESVDEGHHNDSYPFDLTKGKPVKSLQHEDDKIQDDENKRSQFPFPIFWIPGYEKLKNKESDTSPKAIEEQPPKLKIIPVSHGDHGEKSQVVEKNNKAVKVTKEIHVKQIEENETKPADNKVESQSSSPRKSSKLPPLCLRVDPLPRKKNGNGKGTSRSPSPPGEKSRATATALSVHPTSEGKSCSGPVEKVSLENKAENEQLVREINVNEAKDEVNNSKEEAEEATKVEEKRTKKQLSTTEAAVIIQSFHRGHEVRKWKPLKKLKQIEKVSEQVDEVRGRIQTLESSIESQKEGKHWVLIGETIMSLLLQLDTIQGLHPSVRDIRKVVARELVSLQERLDSLVSRNAGGEEKHEVTNSSEACVHEALSETVPSGRCEPPETLEKPKEAENQFHVKEHHSAEAAIETTNIEPNYESSDFQGSVNAKVGESSAEEVGSVQKVQEAQDDSDEEPDKSIVEEVDGVIKAPGGGVEEPTEPTFVAHEKVESEVEKPVEASREDLSCEFHEDHNLGVAQGMDSLDIQDTPEPGADHVMQELPEEAADITKPGGESVVQELPELAADIIEPGAEQVAQESPQGVASISESDAKHSPEVPHGVLEASEIGAEDVQELSPQGVSSISESDAKHSHEVPEGVLEASEIGAEDVQELSPQGVSCALELDAKNVELPHPIPDENQMIRKHEKDERPKHENSSLRVETFPKSDPSEEATANKNVTQEVEMKEEEVGIVNNPSKVEAEDKKLVEENEMLREMIGKLLLEGKQQLTAISDLHGRVKDLERKLTNKKLKMRKHKPKKQHLRSGV